MQPNVFIVKPEQVGQSDVSQFLLSAIAREFGNDYSIVAEQTVDKITHYSKTPRKIRSYAVQARGETHNLFFDVTDVSSANTINWAGR
jgi:hypothetical protein